MSYVSSDMVSLNLDSTRKITLSDFISSGSFVNSIPLTMFGDSVSSSAILKAVSYLKSIGGGSVAVPATDKYNSLRVVVRKNKEGNYITKFEYNNYRYPINVESRPYTEDVWEVGDIVYNSDFENSDDKSIGWICVESGIPGKWVTYGANEEQSIQKIMNRINRTIIIELKADGWSSTAPYTQKVYDTDITSDDYPIVTYYIEENSSADRIREVKDAFSCLDDGTTYDGYIEFTCASEKPVSDFSVILRGV